MSCPYYTFRSNDYYCTKKQDYVNNDVYQRYCKKYSYDECPIYKGNPDSSSCYLTSACVLAKGLPDDCKELTVLRNFRDNWLKKQPGGEAEVAEYYATAPAVVKAINDRADANEVWENLYEALILPCVEMIEKGQMEEVHGFYRETARNLNEVYGGKKNVYFTDSDCCPYCNSNTDDGGRKHKIDKLWFI